jgi:hypothetical protein
MATTYIYGSYIIQDALFRAGELTALSGTTSDYLEASKRYCLRAYYEFLKLYPYPFALKDPPGVISTYATVTGTAICTKGSASVTLGVAVTPSMAGRKFQIDSQGIMYRITAHTTGTTAVTLDATYKEDTVSGGAYTIFEDEYTLASDCMKPWKFWYRNSPETEIEIDSSSNLITCFPDRASTDCAPMKVAYVKGNKVRFSAYFDSAVSIEYEYTARPDALSYDSSASTDTPVIPIEHRHILADWVLYYLQLDKNDSRANITIQEINRNIADLKQWYLPLSAPRLTPKRGRSLAPTH